MKQLYYTSCESGKSLGGGEGFQVRAASADIGMGRMSAALPYMAYGLPGHFHPLQLERLSPLVRLAFLKTPELGPILCHSVSAEPDPTTHRDGNFFSHLILDVLPSFTAGAAIKTWESDSWQHADGPFMVTLPDIEEIHATDVLTDEALWKFISSEHGQRMFRFVLAALLTTGADWRIFVAAPSQDVALCLYGLTRVLPEGCQRMLTFSTYESQPLSCPARVVGTWAANSAETDMPSSCYFGRAVGYNSFTGRASQVTDEGDFVDYAVTAAMTDDRKGLDKLVAICDQCGIDRPELMNLVCRAELRGELSKDDLRQLTPYPRFLAHLLCKLDIRLALLKRFVEDQELADVLTAKVVPVLKENCETIAAFQEIVKRAAMEAMLQGEMIQTRTLLEQILPAASDAPPASARMSVLDEITDPRTVPWPIRAYMLTQIAEISSNGQQCTLLAKWLSPSPAELPLLVSLAIPDRCKTHACLSCLREMGVTHSLVETLISHSDLLLEVLRHLPSDKEAARSFPSLVTALLANSSAPARLVGDVVRHRSQLDPGVISAFLATAARNGAIDVFSLASQCGPGLLDVLASGDDLNNFLIQLLDCPPETLLSNCQVLALFRTAIRTMDRGEIRDGLESVLALRSFLDRPILSEEALARVAMGLKTWQSPLIAKRILEVALDAILAKGDSPSIQPLVESLLQNLGPFTSGGPSGLYRWLLGQFQSKKGFWKCQHLICAMVAIGLGATQSADLSRQAIVMAEQARNLAEETARRSKRKVFVFIEHQSRNWPDEARVRWNLFAKYVKPRSLLSRITGR